jgi:hypothetical protein
MKPFLAAGIVLFASAFTAIAAICIPSLGGQPPF